MCQKYVKEAKIYWVSKKLKDSNFLCSIILNYEIYFKELVLSDKLKWESKSWFGYSNLLDEAFVNKKSFLEILTVWGDSIW